MCSTTIHETTTLQEAEVIIIILPEIIHPQEAHLRVLLPLQGAVRQAEATAHQAEAPADLAEADPEVAVVHAEAVVAAEVNIFIPCLFS